MLLVGLTGDRGLCGGYNTYAIKKIETRAKELEKQGIDFDMICIGNKGNTVSLHLHCSHLPCVSSAAHMFLRFCGCACGQAYMGRVCVCVFVGGGVVCV